MAPASALARVWHSERVFVVALGAAVVLRILVQYAFPPAFVFSDGPTYLGFVDHLVPSPDRPVGYGIALWMLAGVTRGLTLVAVLQHLLGLVTAMVGYALLRRWSVSPRLATLAMLPLLFDEMELVVEHSVLSDVFFDLVLLLAVAALAWHRTPRVWSTAAAGLLLGTATLLRLVGEPGILAMVVFLAIVASSWRQRLLHVVLVTAAFALPLTAYAAWYHHDNGVWAITQSNGRALYMRTTTFVDCSKVQVPAYERPLCPTEPLGSRQDPTWYGWHDPAVLGLRTPAGVTQNQAMYDFAKRAIRAQPSAYAATVGRDLAMGFWAPRRFDYFEYDTQYKWSFTHYVDYVPTPLWTEPAYAAHGGEMPGTRHPVADLLDWYGRVVYVPGPVLFLLLLVAVAGLALRRPDGAPATRPLTFLTLALGVGFVLVPDATAEFVWRYQLPALVLLPMSAALAWTRLRGAPEAQPGTTATPRID
ncbi:hypothetical protein [Nocardioides cynanchi]|uniref:hypothetical protein n=1 Tax=Nocardioides cynanchi TaxID=2558918 RepID=UPI001245DD6E|nr:hypothetical protein [Nocardioides cynanchi]